MTVLEIKDHPVIKAVSQFVFMNDKSNATKLLGGCLHTIKSRKYHGTTDRRRSQRFQVVPHLKLDKIKKRMEKCIANDHKIKLKGTTHDLRWFSDQHENTIHGLKVFSDEDMNLLMRQVLQLKSSKKNVHKLLVNLIRIMWRRKDIPKLVGSSCMANEYFAKPFNFAIQYLNRTSSQLRMDISNALIFLKE